MSWLFGLRKILTVTLLLKEMTAVWGEKKILKKGNTFFNVIILNKKKMLKFLRRKIDCLIKEVVKISLYRIFTTSSH